MAAREPCAVSGRFRASLPPDLKPRRARLGVTSACPVLHLPPALTFSFAGLFNLQARINTWKLRAHPCAPLLRPPWVSGSGAGSSGVRRSIYPAHPGPTGLLSTPSCRSDPLAGHVATPINGVLSARGAPAAGATGPSHRCTPVHRHPGIQLQQGGRHLPIPQQRAARREPRAAAVPEYGMPLRALRRRTSAPAEACHPCQTALPSAQSEATRHFFQRVEQCKPLWSSLQRACRRVQGPQPAWLGCMLCCAEAQAVPVVAKHAGADDAFEGLVPCHRAVLLPFRRKVGLEVIYTVIQSLTADGRDRGLDYKLSGFHVPPGSPDAQVRQQQETDAGGWRPAAGRLQHRCAAPGAA